MSSRQTAKQRKLAAAARFKSARNEGRSALDDWEDTADDAVYDHVTEEDYRQLVESRRDREDFVVDDEGLGYHDDGEEVMGGEAESSTQAQKQRSATASLTQQALRKARKNKQTKTAVLTASDGKAMKNTSMWDFINPVTQTNGAKPTSSIGNSSGDNHSAVNRSSKRKTAVNVDDLLAELDEEAPSSSLRPRKQRKGRSTTTRPSLSSRSRVSFRPTKPKRQSHHHDRPLMEDDDDKNSDEYDDDAPIPLDDYSDDGRGYQEADGGDTNDQDIKMEGEIPEEPTNLDGLDNETSMATTATSEDAKQLDDGIDAAPRRRRRVSQLGKVSAPAQQALEKQAAAVAKVAATQGKLPPTSSSTVMASSLPAAQMQSVESAGSSLGVPAGQMELSDVTSNDYLDMFWMDLCERQGQVILFGKVLKPDGTAVSAAVVVENCERNLFALPRSDVDPVHLHKELTELLKKHVFPKAAGSTWKGKLVKRSYAFDDETLPRDTTDYFKIVYDAKLPAMPTDICEQGGATFSRILNSNVSLTETFILKRKLMGPCWLRLQNPVPTKGPLTWARLEVRLASPKLVVKLDLVEGAMVPPTPAVSSMTVQFKTIVHPRTHQSEIVSLSAVLHTQVPLDVGSPSEHPKFSRHLSLVRPIPTADGPLPLPRDWESKIVQKMPNERALLSRFLAQVHQWDPDVWMGHNVWGYGMEVLLQRCTALKLKNWSQVGRRRQNPPPRSIKDWTIAQSMTGRLLCDTYLSAKELLRETTYSLTALSASQLQAHRPEIEAVDLPLYFQSAQGVTQVCQSTLYDAQLVQKLAFKLQTLPLTKQLTNIAGNMWSHTLKSNRAERTEYLLLHEFHRLKYLPPEKRSKSSSTAETSKAKYAGGLVLEPKKGLYDSFILLLDFNSLYPSLIQEYNLCFTTLDWARYKTEGDAEMPLPDTSSERGVLPRVIQSLVERRRNVKSLLKSEEDAAKKQELDIRQKALKLTANSMYGCLGFSHSRFFAQPIAAKVTQLGRQTLQMTVDIAQNSVGLDVIYGDTDSIMINTRLNQDDDLAKVYKLGEEVKRQVNKSFRKLELEIDGIFRSMLLLKKKKYAAKTVEEQKNGKVVKYGQELKGLDLVRRDWCVQSKDTGRYVTEQILSGQENEVVVQSIHSHLEDLAKTMRKGELALEKYVITKGLSKHPKDYPDGKSLPHVQVAKQMLANNRPVNTGDHIPYVITAPTPPDDPLPEDYKVPSATERARHPEEIVRSNGALKPDVEWYLTQQILPPIARLCEPIEGTSQQELALRLGLDAKRYSHMNRSDMDLDADQAIDYKPACSLPDEERFKDVEKLQLFCLSCQTVSAFPGVFATNSDGTVVSGMKCPNPQCARPTFWGHANPFDCYARMANSMSIWCHGLTSKYYEGTMKCDEASCGLETRQLSVAGSVCLRMGCPGKLQPMTTERSVHTHLRYLERLVNIEHAAEQLAAKGKFGTTKEIERTLSKHEKEAFTRMHKMACSCVDASAYNWITPGFWQGLFRMGQVTKQ